MLHLTSFPANTPKGTIRCKPNLRNDEQDEVLAPIYLLFAAAAAAAVAVAVVVVVVVVVEAVSLVVDVDVDVALLFVVAAAFLPLMHCCYKNYCYNNYFGVLVAVHYEELNQFHRYRMGARRMTSHATVMMTSVAPSTVMYNLYFVFAELLLVLYAMRFLVYFFERN